MSLQEKFSPFCESLRKSIDNENWYSALVLAVTLPDICCTLDGTKKGKLSKEPYIAWFNKYINNFKMDWYSKEGIKTPTITLNGTNAYSIRCDVLHQGGTDISKHKSDKDLGYDKVEFHLTSKAKIEVTGMDFMQGVDEDTLYLNIRLYCNSILHGVEKWLRDYEIDRESNIKSERLITIIED